MSETKPLLEGTISLDEGVTAFSGATIHVYIEDVSMAGGTAPSIGEYLERNVTYNGNPLSFQIYGQIPNAARSYNLRVHISVDSSDDIKKGDFITKQSYPILTKGNPDTIHVRAEKV